GDILCIIYMSKAVLRSLIYQNEQSASVRSFSFIYRIVYPVSIESRQNQSKEHLLKCEQIARLNIHSATFEHPLFSLGCYLILNVWLDSLLNEFYLRLYHRHG